MPVHICMPTEQGDIYVDDPSEQLDESIHRLKAALVARSRGENADMTEADYRAIRKQLLGHPKLREVVPAWLRTASTLVEVTAIIKTEGDRRSGIGGGRWASRAAMIAEGLNPLLEELHQQRATFEASGDLGERIGGGGFGEVFRWHHKLLDMDFAVKVLHPSFPSSGGTYVDRFMREARILIKLNHPNIVKVYDVGMHGKRPYIRMELLEGRNLNTALQDNGRIEPKQAAVILLALSEALSHAHDQGIVHRDIKPSNVFQTNDGRICLIDFGLGAFVEDDLISRLTVTGEAPAGGLFTAPELIENPRKLDPRTDLYSAGAVWFTALTGQPPAGTAVSAKLRTIPGLSQTYQRAVERSLDDEASRYQTAAELAERINELLNE